MYTYILQHIYWTTEHYVVERCRLKAFIHAKYRNSEQDLQNSEQLHYCCLWLTCSNSSSIQNDLRFSSLNICISWPGVLFCGFLNMFETFRYVFFSAIKDTSFSLFYSAIFFITSECPVTPIRIHIFVYVPVSFSVRKRPHTDP